MRVKLILFIISHNLEIKDIAESLGINEIEAGKKILGQASITEKDIEAFEAEFGKLAGYRRDIFINSLLDVLQIVNDRVK